MRSGQCLQLFAQFRVGPHARLFQLDDLVVDFFQRILQRFDQLVDRGLTSFEVSPGRLLELFEILPCEIEKRLVVVAKRVCRQRFERVGEFLFRVGKQREFFLVHAAFFFETCLQGG